MCSSTRAKNPTAGSIYGLWSTSLQTNATRSGTFCLEVSSQVQNTQATSIHSYSLAWLTFLLFSARAYLSGTHIVKYVWTLWSTSYLSWQMLSRYIILADLSVTTVGRAASCYVDLLGATKSRGVTIIQPFCAPTALKHTGRPPTPI